MPVIDHSRCTLCLKCIPVCPKNVLIEIDKKIEIQSDDCMLCSHCYDVCKFGSISFGEDLKELSFRSFNSDDKVISSNKINPGNFVNIIRSRRSIRKYQTEEIGEDIIHDLLEFAVSAPSGSNRQDWEFIVINGREKVWDLAKDIGKFFEKINRYAKNRFIRYASIFFMGKKLIDYYNERLESVEMALKEAESGKDLLFWGAPALLILHGPISGSTPKEDAQYASYNITLLAHALGLGTCFIGYATESINRAKDIKRKLEISPENKVYAVLTLGYPDVKYEKPSLRKKYRVKIFK